MINKEPGAELSKALQSLAAAAREFSREVTQPLPYEVSLDHLKAVVQSLGLKTVPEPLELQQIEMALGQWNEFLGGGRERLEARAVRCLCWQPGIATDERFQDYLDRSYPEVNSEWLQGLVHSCHASWSPVFGSGSVTRRVRGRLECYQGTHRLLLRWKNVARMLIGPQGTGEFAASLIESQQPVKVHCAHWGLDDQTPYVLEAVRLAVKQCGHRIGLEAANRTNLHAFLIKLLRWTGWPLEAFKAEIGAIILHPAATAGPELRELITYHVLGHEKLGDPRLAQNRTNWEGVPDAARAQFIEWLSGNDKALSAQTAQTAR